MPLARKKSHDGEGAHGKKKKHDRENFNDNRQKYGILLERNRPSTPEAATKPASALVEP